MIALVADHLWQSTLCAGIVGLLMLALRRNRPQVRYALWLAASVKFLLPFAALVAIGGQIGWRSAPIVQPRLTAIIEPFSIVAADRGQPDRAARSAPARGGMSQAASIVLVSIWLCGLVAIGAIWLARWRRVAAAGRPATPVGAGRDLDCVRRLEPA